MKIKLNTDGHWYVSITCDGVEAKPLPTTGKVVGVDLGVTTFAATSDGEMFENPREDRPDGERESSPPGRCILGLAKGLELRYS